MARTRRGSFRSKVSHNAMQQRSKASNYGHLKLPRGVNVFKETPGSRVALDILPYFVTSAHHPDRDESTETAIENTPWYRLPYKLHRSIGASNDSIVCPTSIGKKCPICEHRTKQISDGAKWQDEEIKAMRPQNKNLYYVVPRKNKDYEEKPYIWDISQFLFQDALNNELEENDEFGDFPDIDNGLTLRIRFSEEKFEKTSFAKTSRIDFEQRDYTYEESIVKGLVPLEGVLDVKDYREVERLFFASDDEPVDDDDETTGSHEAPPPPKSISMTRTRSEPSTKDEDKDDEDNPPIIARSFHASDRPSDPPHDPETGEILEEDEEEEEHQTPAPPKEKASSSSRNIKAATNSSKCPFGHTFGVDTDKKDECEECKIWGECMDEMELLASK